MLFCFVLVSLFDFCGLIVLILVFGCVVVFWFGFDFVLCFVYVCCLFGVDLFASFGLLCYFLVCVCCLWFVFAVGEFGLGWFVLL